MPTLDTATCLHKADRAIAAALLTIAAACHNSTTAPIPAASLVLSSGGSQTAAVASVLAAPVSVKVADQSGFPISGVTVTFAPNARSGVVSAAQATTDQNGLAQVSWNLGTAVGVDSLTARIDSLSTVIVATATPGAPASVLPVNGAGRNAPAGSTLSIQLSVIVLDAYDNPVPNASLVWTDNAGGLFAGGNTSVTNATGVAAITYTLGPSAGTNDVYASVGAGSATHFATFVEQGM